MYQYRKGASEYFGGSKTSNDDENVSKPKKAVKRNKKKEVEGGCG
jgi:hypothetical protein